jgi:hypothetical protein
MKTTLAAWPDRGGGLGENQLISSSTQSQYLKTTPKPDLVQNKLIPTSLSTNWIENERFELVSTKTIIFMPKTGSLNSGTGVFNVQGSTEAVA